MDLRIAVAAAEDLDDAARLFDAYRQFYGRASDRDAAREFLRERLERRQSMVLLARNQARAVGFTQLYPMFSSVRLAPVWVLNDLYVDSDARRGGVARRLLEAAAVVAREGGAVRLMLETARENLPARALYRAAGWEEDATQWYSLDLAEMQRLG